MLIYDRGVCMYLMLKDVTVVYFDLEDFVVEVIKEELLPFGLRANIRPPVTNKDILHNVSAVKSYLSSRVLSLSRDNAKQIYAAFGIPQIDSTDNRVNICIKCKGVSIQDSFWIKGDEDDLNWENVNIRKNKLSDIVDLSLNGFAPAFTTSYICPELTTKGLFRKGWVCIGKSLYLLKSDKTSDYVNTRMEVLASRILECFANRVDSISYVGDRKETSDGTLYISICKNFVNERYSFVEAWEVMEYFKRCGIEFKEYCMKHWGYQFASIPVLDYLIINTDRHTQNYGFLMDNDTGVLEMIAPLFDFNCALVADYFSREAGDTYSQMFNTTDTLRGLAYEFLDDTKLYFSTEMFGALEEENKQYSHIFEKVHGRVKELHILEY